MADYKKRTYTGNSNSRPYTTGKSFAQKEMFDAECNSCHKRCQVPFRPNGKKPVYCADCFSKNDSGPREARGNGREDRGSTYHRDSQARPQRSFGTESSDRQLQELKREVEAMNATLKNLVTAVDTFNRATALTLEIQKHFPSGKPAVKKTSTTKKSVSKEPKAPPKKAGK